MVKVGDRFDPVVLGHADIDIKDLFVKEGYVGEMVPKLTRPEELPDPVRALYDTEVKDQGECSRLEPTGIFECPHCKARNSSHWRRIPTGEEFVVCGECNRVTGVR